VIIITGASRGLGEGIRARLVEGGRGVISIARNVDNIPEPAFACDVGSYADLKAVAAKIKAAGIEVAGVINAAGIASMNLAITTPPRSTQAILQTNLAGTIYSCQVFAPLLLRNKAGCIINFSTIAVALGLKGESVYAASKAGVEAFSRVFAREMADFGVRVNCIAPGPIKTDLLNGVTDEQIDRIVRRQIIPRRFTPNDVCDLVELLLDHRATSLSGQVLSIGGS